LHGIAARCAPLLNALQEYNQLPNDNKSQPYLRIEGVNAWYGKNHVLADVSLNIPKNSIYAFIGPSGCGKTTLLRSINRLNDLVPSYRLDGLIEIGGEDIYSRKGSQFVENLRKRCGMVFQQPNPLPMTIMQNMLFPVREQTKMPRQQMRDLAYEKLKLADLFDEVSGKLNKPAFGLSGGQQQRLCIARALMLEPELILLDEPCSALDPISMHKIEDMLNELKTMYTIIIVTHNMEQAKRISDNTAFFYEGRIIESGDTIKLFTYPETDMLDRYIRGIF